MQDIISTLKNALQQAEAGLEVAVGRLADGTERGEFQPSEVLALACVREALSMPVPCLHQIQEPAAAEQAAWHAGLDEGRAQAAPAAVAVPDERAAFEAWAISFGVDLSKEEGDGGYFYSDANEMWAAWQARAALAATPAAVPTYIEVRECSDCGHIGINDADGSKAACSKCDWQGDSPVEDKCPDCNTVGTMTAACSKCGARASLLAETTLNAEPIAPTAAAPVVLPEPDAWLATPVMQSGRGTTTVFCSDKRMADQWDYGGHPEYGRMLVTGLFTEQQVRALLAQAATAAAPAHPAEGMPADLHAAIMNIPVNKAKLEHLGINERLQYKIGHRDARHDAAELAVVHASPQAQADARDAESDYQRGYRHGYNRRDAEVQGALL